MKWLVLLLGMGLLADEPKPTPEAKEIASLKEQLAQLKALYAYDSAICSGALQAARQYAIKPKEK